MRKNVPIQRLLKLILILGIGVLLFTLVYPLYQKYAPRVVNTVPDQGKGIINEVIWDEGADGIQTPSTVLKAEPLIKAYEKQKQAAKEEEEAVEEEEGVYDAPIQSPILYEPEEPTENPIIIDEGEEEEVIEEEEVREEVPDYFEGRDRYAIDRPFQDIELPEKASEALEKEEAEQYGQLSPGQRQVLEEAEDTAPRSGYAKNVAPPKPTAKERRYLEKGWQKFSSYKGGFNVWVPAALYYVVSKNGNSTEVYQCDADGIYYGLQRRKLDKNTADLSDLQAKNILRHAFEEWQVDFAAGIPGFRVVSSAFTRDLEIRKTDSVMGADAGQVRLRIFITDNYMFWMWTVYRHEDKERADHNMYVNSIELLQK